jgi:D-beta-D-heptose 7-phosphate kinase/D-beta-D-heptose 1-phosphate adenosyltransferase
VSTKNLVEVEIPCIPALPPQHSTYNTKLMAVHTLKKLKHLRKELSDKKTVFISGCFDLLHEGHLAFLKRAKKFDDVLIVGVLSDKYIRNHKKRNPAQNHLHRARLIDSLKFVDCINQ